MNLSCITFGIIFSLAGGLMATGKLHPHLSFWKQMPDEEKDKINILALCRNIGDVIALSGIIFLVGGFNPFFKAHVFSKAMIVWLIIAGMDVWFINKSERYIKE